jgi:hypothetical protein
LQIASRPSLVGAHDLSDASTLSRSSGVKPADLAKARRAQSGVEPTGSRATRLQAEAII